MGQETTQVEGQSVPRTHPERLHIDGRLARLETVVENLASSIGRLTEDMSSLATFSRGKSQTNWGTIFAGVTLMVALVAGYVGLPLSNLKDQTTRMHETLKEQIDREHSFMRKWIEEGFIGTNRDTKDLQKHIAVNSEEFRKWKDEIQAKALPGMALNQSRLDSMTRLLDRLEHQIEFLHGETVVRRPIVTDGLK